MRALHRLTHRRIVSETKPGSYADGGGLYFRVREDGARSWVFKYQLNGVRREMGLGPLLKVPLAVARDKAEALRYALGRGEDPYLVKQADKAAARARMTFWQCAEAYIEAQRGGWKNPKHVAQWTSTLATYAKPKFGSLDVASVSSEHVLSALKPIWTDKPETASRLRGRIERVLAWATTSGLRKGENPARWRGHLDTLLPSAKTVAKVQHHPALPFKEIAPFMTLLQCQPGVAARALEFTILTAARTNEVIGATWDEIDLRERVWTIPAARMKAKKEHRVPLCDRAMHLLQTSERFPGSNHVFIGAKAGGLSNMAMLKVLQRMDRQDLTVHGFRSTFRDWAGEVSNHDRAVVEHALAHQLKDKAEAAYARGTLFHKRVALMNDWAAYVAGRGVGQAEKPQEEMVG